MIDYLQLMTGGKKAESRQNEVSELSRNLKVAARELNVPIIVLSQLSRAVETRKDAVVEDKTKDEISKNKIILDKVYVLI